MSTDIDPASGRLYARLWRWHFFAALLVIPFILWQSVTGALYVWHEELADRLYPELRFVAPRGERVSYAAQLAAALAHHPGERLGFLQIIDDPTRSTMFVFNAANGLNRPAFVDPYSGAWLGAIEPAAWLPGLTRELHGGWPINPYGSYLLELGASWAIVMILTGLYLWWPRQANGLAGVLYPRLRAGPRVFWRDLHATIGIYASGVTLAFLITALPWTAFWGDRILDPIQRLTGQVAPTARFFGVAASPDIRAHVEHGGQAAVLDELAASLDDSAAAQWLAPRPPLRLPLDDLIARARAQGLSGVLEIVAPTADGPLTIRSRRARAADEVHVRLDRGGDVLDRADWAQFPAVPKAVATGVDLHEGTYFGRASQIFNTALALALIGLCVTGFMGWYRRRPGGGFAPPPWRAVVLPDAVAVTGIVLALLLPLLGFSLVILVMIDTLLRRLWPRSAGV